MRCRQPIGHLDIIVDGAFIGDCSEKCFHGSMLPKTVDPDRVTCILWYVPQPRSEVIVQGVHIAYIAEIRS